MFVLIAPSANVEWQFENCLQESSEEEPSPLSPWNIHRIIFADSLQGWMDYMASLEERLKRQVSDFIIVQWC